MRIKYISHRMKTIYPIYFQGFCSHLVKIEAFLVAFGEIMSRDSLMTSMPSRSWSCSTLEQGVKACAQMAGLNLKSSDAPEACMVGR